MEPVRNFLLYYQLRLPSQVLLSVLLSSEIRQVC